MIHADLTQLLEVPPRQLRPLREYLGYEVGSGQCVALVQYACGAPLTKHWVRGTLVRANLAVPRGAVIATFDAAGKYENKSGSSHAAVYLGQDASGIHVVDQWIGMPAHFRRILFRGEDPQVRASNNGDLFYTLELE